MSTARREPQLRTLRLCYITDRRQFPGDDKEQQLRLLEKISECAAAGVDFIQLREKDLSPRVLERLSRSAVAAIPAGSPAKVLINSRTDVALASGAHGVHLPAHDIPPSEARVIWDRTGKPAAVIGASVHSLEEVALAEEHGADFAVFGPVFEKDGRTSPQGLELLRQACRRPHHADVPMPLLALGGVTLENAQRCLDAGAGGIAAIRLFQDHDPAVIAGALRSLGF